MSDQGRDKTTAIDWKANSLGESDREIADALLSAFSAVIARSHIAENVETQETLDQWQFYGRICMAIGIATGRIIGHLTDGVTDRKEYMRNYLLESVTRNIHSGIEANDSYYAEAKRN